MTAQDRGSLTLARLHEIERQDAAAREAAAQSIAASQREAEEKAASIAREAQAAMDAAAESMRGEMRQQHFLQTGRQAAPSQELGERWLDDDEDDAPPAPSPVRSATADDRWVTDEDDDELGGWSR